MKQIQAYSWVLALLVVGYIVGLTEFHASMDKRIYGCHEETLPLEVEKDCGRILGSRYKSQRAIERGIQYTQQQQAPRMFRTGSTVESGDGGIKVVGNKDL